MYTALAEWLACVLFVRLLPQRYNAAKTGGILAAALPLFGLVHFLDEYRFKNDETALVRFADIDSQERVRELTGCDVYFPREHVDTDGEELSWAAIVGFKVIDERTGKVVGEIHSVDDSTINTLFCLLTPDGTDLLIPASDDLIVEVDAEHRSITMNLPEGLTEL